MMCYSRHAWLTASAPALDQMGRNERVDGFNSPSLLHTSTFIVMKMHFVSLLLWQNATLVLNGALSAWEFSAILHQLLRKVLIAIVSLCCRRHQLFIIISTAVLTLSPPFSYSLHFCCHRDLVLGDLWHSAESACAKKTNKWLAKSIQERWSAAAVFFFFFFYRDKESHLKTGTETSWKVEGFLLRFYDKTSPLLSTEFNFVISDLRRHLL